MKTVILACGHDVRASDNSPLVKKFYKKERPNTFWCRKCSKAMEVNTVY